MAGIDSYVELLVRGGGANGSQVFNDLSPDYRTLTTTGSYISHSTAYTKFQSSSIVVSCYGFNYVAAANHTDLAMGSGNFTVDFWVYPLSFANAFDICNKSWRIRILNTGALNIYDSSIGLNFSSTATLNLSQWSHVALVRNGTTFTFYINGVARGTATNSGTMVVSSNTFKIGPNYNYSTSWVAAIDEFRLSRGIARWTADFTPPTAAYTGDEFTMTASGGAVAGGSAAVIDTIVVAPSSGAIVGGNTYYHYSTERVIATGGVISGGAATVQKSVTGLANGGAIAGGIASTNSYQHVASGGAVIAGTAANIGTLVSPPTHHWTFNDITDNIVANEIIGGETLLCNGRTQVEGIFNYALSGGTPTHPLEVDNEISFKSISMWVKRYDLIEDVYLIYNSVNPRWLRIQASSGALQFYNGTDIVTSNLTITDTNWHHLCIVESITNQHWLYLDNVKASAELVTNFNTVQFFSLYTSSIGYRDPLNDNIQVYRRSITDSDVEYLFNAISDETSLPRLPSLTITINGGAVASGEATIELHNKGMTVVATGGAVNAGSATIEFSLLGMSFVASGGAVVGGSGEYPYLWSDGTYPEYTGDATLETTTIATIFGSCPNYYGDIQVGLSILGYCPEYVGDASTEHTVQLEVNGDCPEYVGESGLIVTQIINVLGYCPDYIGTADIDVHTACDIIGDCPEYYGSSVIIPIRSISVLGYCPEYSGYSIIDIENSSDDVLSFNPYNMSSISIINEGDCPAYICDIQVNSGDAETILSFVRGH